MAGGSVFILRVLIDATSEVTALVPDPFKAVHMEHLEGGDPTPEFVQRLRRLFSGSRA